jgi:hypothetical protein
MGKDLMTSKVTILIKPFSKGDVITVKAPRKWPKVPRNTAPSNRMREDSKTLVRKKIRYPKIT